MHARSAAQQKQTGEVILKSYNVWVERSHARLHIIPARICIQRGNGEDFHLNFCAVHWDRKPRNPHQNTNTMRR